MKWSIYNLEEKSLEIYNYLDELAALEEKLSSLTDKLEQKKRSP
jgi:hypothetical protein